MLPHSNRSLSDMLGQATAICSRPVLLDDHNPTIHANPATVFQEGRLDVVTLTQPQLREYQRFDAMAEHLLLGSVEVVFIGELPRSFMVT